MKHNIKPKFKLWLAAEDSAAAFGDGKWRLLCAIEKYQSLRLACEQLGMSYRKGWGDLKRAEELLGFALVEKTRGGPQGGKTTLTEKGTAILKSYRKFRSELEKTAQKNFKKYLSGITD